MSAPPPATIPRHYGMDWLRIGAFALLIFYHIGMVFVPWGFHVKTDAVQDWVVYPMLLVNPWRLSLLFLVSGFASRALLSKGALSPGGFLKRRSGRLLLPLVFGSAVIVAPQSWAEWRFKTGYDGDFLTYWLTDYWTFGFVDGVPMPTYNHLWFILYLFVYTLLLVLALWLLSAGARARVQAIFNRVFGNSIAWLALPTMYLILTLLLIGEDGVPPQIFWGDWWRHAVYFAVFLIGYGLAGSEAAWAAIRNCWRTGFVIAVIGYLASLWFSFAEAATQIDLETRGWLIEGFKAAQQWGAITGLIGLADRYWNRDAPLRRYLALGVYPFYIIHQTIIILVALWAVEAGLPVWTQFALNLVATVLGCWLFYELALRTGPLRPLFGLRAKPAG